MAKKSAKQIVDSMMANDAFSKFLGIKIISIKKGYCKLSCTIKPNFLNGFGIAHGGITYSVADSALAFASNAHGKKSLSVETTISHTKPLTLNTTFFTEAICINQTKKFGHYNVNVYLKDKKIVALFKGVVFINEEEW